MVGKLEWTPNSKSIRLEASLDKTDEATWYLCHQHFFFVTNSATMQARAFVPGKPFFLAWSNIWGGYLRGEPAPLGWVPASLTNIQSVWKVLPWTIDYSLFWFLRY
jgi:hypothetical protein